MMREDLQRYELKPTERYVVEFFLLKTFVRGQPSLFVPGPVRRLAELMRVDEKDLGKIVNGLKKSGVLAVDITRGDPGGVDYTLNPDSAGWGGLVEKCSREEVVNRQQAMLRDPNQREIWPERFCQDSLGAVKARLGMEAALQQPESAAQGEIPPVRSNAETPASGVRGEIPPAPCEDWRIGWQNLKRSLEPVSGEEAKEPAESCPGNAGPLAQVVARVLEAARPALGGVPPRQLATTTKGNEVQAASSTDRSGTPQEKALAWLQSIDTGGGLKVASWAAAWLTVCSNNPDYINGKLRRRYAQKSGTFRNNDPLSYLYAIARADREMS